jgi:opacity protein-like surface antigen
MHKQLFIAVPMFCSLFLPAAKAEQQPNSLPAFSPEERFQTGRFEAAFNNGVLFSPFAPANNRPTINYTITELQIGYMLSGVKGPGLLRGNFETALEGFGSAIFDGPGSFIAGVTLWGRYNFVQPGARLIPYIQGGLGLTSTDIDREIVGQPFNFNLNAGGGLRYFITSHWSLSLEYRYQHISNANTGSHNIGINSHGPILGLSYFF